MSDKLRSLIDRFGDLVQEVVDSGFSEDDNEKFQKILVVGVISFYTIRPSNEQLNEIASEVIDYIQRRIEN